MTDLDLEALDRQHAEATHFSAALNDMQRQDRAVAAIVNAYPQLSARLRELEALIDDACDSCGGLVRRDGRCAFCSALHALRAQLEAKTRGCEEMEKLRDEWKAAHFAERGKLTRMKESLKGTQRAIREAGYKSAAAMLNPIVRKM